FVPDPARQWLRGCRYASCEDLVSEVFRSRSRANHFDDQIATRFTSRPNPFAVARTCSNRGPNRIFRRDTQCSAVTPAHSGVTAVNTRPRRSALLHRLDVLEQYLLVALRIHFFVNLAQVALRVDHEAGAVPVLGPIMICLPDARGFEQLGVGIGEQIDREGELVAEVLVRGDVVRADADHLDSSRVEIGLARRERLTLDGAAGSVVLGIDVHHQPFAGEVAELRLLVILVLERKIWKWFSCLEHYCFPFVAHDELKIAGRPTRTTAAKAARRGDPSVRQNLSRRAPIALAKIFRIYLSVLYPAALPILSISSADTSTVRVVTNERCPNGSFNVPDLCPHGSSSNGLTSDA